MKAKNVEFAYRVKSEGVNSGGHVGVARIQHGGRVMFQVVVAIK